MKIAVLMSGQARHVERRWYEFWRRRFFPFEDDTINGQYKVDYFLHP